VTLNGVMAVILRHLTEFGNFGAKHIWVVEVWPCCPRKNVPKGI